MDACEPKLEHLFDIHADLEAPQVVGATPQGVRQIFIVKGGAVDGPRLKGKMLPAAATGRSSGQTAQCNWTSARQCRPTTARSSTRPTEA
jgi:hypothetical protein